MNVNKAALVLLLFAWFGGCLPEFMGTFRPMSSDEFGDEEGVVPYRILTLEDLRSSASSDNAPHAGKTGVVICTQIRTASQSKVVAIPQPLLRRGGFPGYIANFKDLAFYAVLDRQCSEWNERNTDWEVSVLLDHEQAHFAIMEIAARQLNLRLHEGSLKFRFQGTTQDEVARAGERFVTDTLTKSTEHALVRSQQFDLETDYGSLVQKQIYWVELLQQELDDLADYAASP